SLEPRAGYREPVIHEYYPGCFVNAVGLANPGAHAFLGAMRPFLPLHDHKPLIVSIMGVDAEEFLECALVLDPIADAFELNLSCPHVKGAGQSVGSDPAAVRSVIALLKERLNKPIIAKLSPNLGDIPGMARLCRDAGADGLSLINTVGPGVAVDADGNPVLSNVAGGLSGAGILPVGIRAVAEAASTVDLPIIASGGITSSRDVLAYRKAGASLFAVGSALAGMATGEISAFFEQLIRAVDTEPHEPSPQEPTFKQPRTSYFKTRVTDNTPFGEGLFRIRLQSGPPCEPGRFFFLRLPGVGEKPFSPADDLEPLYLVRTVGPFTRALAELRPGDAIYMRGPYGRGFPEPAGTRGLILLGGGTGAAPVMMAASRWGQAVARVFLGFSAPVKDWFQEEIRSVAAQARIVIDEPDRVGQVVESLAADLKANADLYREARVFICGPDPMMRAATKILEPIVPREQIFIAREDLMRCGIGLCGSCATGTGLRSCVDGPVMNPE
ncbi:MAG: dihydroorotate dehydrogenase, partial [Deltaproteobacteria bacterium]|nr:dihydroorotate dehydrogenase [Deltaproteobacteria bacterium]